MEETMADQDILHGERFLEGARANPGRVAVPRADNEEALEAVALAVGDGVVRGGTLFGPRDAVESVARQVGLDLSLFDLVPTDSDAEAAAAAVRLVVDGRADFLLKGQLDTKIYLKAVLDKDLGLVPEGNTLTHVTVVGMPGYHKPLLFTDAAILIAPDLADKVRMVRNIVDVARRVGVATPKVSLIAAVEKVNPKIPATIDAAAIAKMAAEGAFPGALVAGPHDLYIATSAEAARIKGVSDAVAGDADCLVFPDLNSANVFYKTLQRFVAGAWNAGFVAGARIPILLPSRADTARTKRMSILVAAYLAGKAG
jgi:phosphate butyryltransferase